MPKLIPKEKIKKIKLLRQKGYSLPEIKKEVQVGHGSVFRYIQGVEILPEYKQIWHSKRGGSLKRMKIAEKKAGEKAESFFPSLNLKEKAIFLAALYWGEGTKKDFSFSNSDPKMIKVFVRGLKEVFNIDKNRLRVSVRIYKDLDRNRSLDFWSKITGISAKRFMNVNILDGKKKGKLLYGMCRVRIIKGGDVLKYVLALKNRVVDLF